MQNNNGSYYRIGRAYIALPTDLDRTAYVRDCYINNWVSLIAEDGGFMNRVPISPEALNFIEFPPTPSDLGSPVCYGVDEETNNPMVIARFSQQGVIGDNKEYGFKFKRSFRDRVVEIFGSPKDNTLNFIVNGGQSGGRLNLSLFSSDRTSIMDVFVAGSINLKAQNTILLEGLNKTTIQTLDPTYKSKAILEQSSNSHRFINDKFNINDGKENFLLGQKWKKLMSDFIDEIASATVSTSIGQQPLINAQKIATFKERLAEPLSSVGFIDK